MFGILGRLFISMNFLCLFLQIISFKMIFVVTKTNESRLWFLWYSVYEYHLMFFVLQASRAMNSILTCVSIVFILVDNEIHFGSDVKLFMTIIGTHIHIHHTCLLELIVLTIFIGSRSCVHIFNESRLG